MEQNVNYDLLCAQMECLADGVPYEMANLANASALLWQTLEGINWAGFYKMMDGKLVLGPFQGKTACIEIPFGRGVCGTAAAAGTASAKTRLIKINKRLVIRFNLPDLLFDCMLNIRRRLPR